MIAAWIALLMALGLMVAPALAGERVDFFNAKGQRTGYAVVDQKSGRVDFYDMKSRRTGWGRVDSTGRVERFGLDGKRQKETVLPFTPQEKDVADGTR